MQLISLLIMLPLANHPHSRQPFSHVMRAHTVNIQ